jgi:hypothetical protein
LAIPRCCRTKGHDANEAVSFRGKRGKGSSHVPASTEIAEYGGTRGAAQGRRSCARRLLQWDPDNRPIRSERPCGSEEIDGCGVAVGAPERPLGRVTGTGEPIGSRRGASVLTTDLARVGVGRRVDPPGITAPGTGLSGVDDPGA